MIIPIVSLKGGVGRTTIAINLADHLSLKKPTLLIDTDQRNSVASLLCQSISKGFSEVLAKQADLKEIIYQPFENNKNFHIIPAGEFAIYNSIEYEKMFEIDKVKPILQKCSEMFEYIFLDIEPRISKHIYTLLKLSDFFIVLINATPASAASLNIFLKELRQKKLTNYSVIVNNFQPTQIHEDFYAFIQNITQNNIIEVIPYDISILEAEAKCLPIRQYAPQSPFNIYIKKIVRKLNEYIHKRK